MDRTLIGILAGAAVVMGVTCWAFYPKTPPEPPEKDRRFMHCSKCGRELPYMPARAAKGCPLCGDTTRLVATTKSIVEAGGLPNPWVKIFAPLLIEGNILVVVIIVYSARRKKQGDDEEFLYTECPRCSQRLRYRLDRVGRAGLCPRCKHGLVFPPPEEEERTTQWWPPRRFWQTLKGKMRINRTTA